MELTQQHFDEQIKKLATKNDLDNQTTDLKKFATEQTEELARMVVNSVVGPLQDEIRKVSAKLDMNERMELMEKDMRQIKGALHLS